MITYEQVMQKIEATKKRFMGVKDKIPQLEAILDENEPEQEEPLPYISRATFEKMKHDVKWVQENLKAIERSRGIWPKLGRRSS